MDDLTLWQISDLVSSLFLWVPLVIFAIRLLTRKTLVVSGLKAAIVIGVLFFTGFMARLAIQDMSLSPSYGLLIPTALMSLALVLFLKNWFMVFNVEETSLRESIRAVLQKLNIQFTESPQKITLTDTSTSLEITNIPFYSSSRIHFTGKLPTSFLEELQIRLTDNRITKTNWFALMMLFWGLFMLSTGLSDFLPDNGMGMSSIPYGQPLTFGEVILERTIILIPLGFLLWAVMGIVLGLRLLFRRPLLLSPWWIVVPSSIPSLVFAFRSVLSQILYGFDFSDSMFALFMVFLLVPLLQYGWGHYVFDMTEDDFLSCLKTVLAKHNIPYVLSGSRVVFGSDNSYAYLTSTEWATAIIHLGAKPSINRKDFLSDARDALSKLRLVGFPKMGVTILLVSLAFLSLWLLPWAIASVFRAFGM